MAQARFLRWLHPALLIAAAVVVSSTVRGAPAQPLVGQQALAQVAAVAWAPSDGLVVGEVVTGGTSASDEFVEIYNSAVTDRDLGGLELVYVTSSGSTVTRKQTWTQLTLGAHRHLLIANSAGKWATGADGLYSSGFAATGGSLVLRTLGGSVVDALSWGDASSSFVEGAAGPAPAANSSLERKPGGALGNGMDTNDNLADTRIEPSPVPQSLASDPVPGATATPIPTTTQTATPEPTVGPTPTPSPTPTSTPVPTPVPTEPCTPEPSSSPSRSNRRGNPRGDGRAHTADHDPSLPHPHRRRRRQPVPTASMQQTPIPTGAVTPEPTVPPMPTASPTPPLELAAIRHLPIGTEVVARGYLTTPTGLIDGGRTAFIEDGGAGIALHLESADWPLMPAGTNVVAAGVLDVHDGMLVVELATAAALITDGLGPVPMPLMVATGLACEPFEARLIAVEGLITGAAVVDDGTGPLSVIAEPGTSIPATELPLGARMRLTGVLGQVDPTGVGGGYRLYLRSLDDVVLVVAAANTVAQPDPDSGTNSYAQSNANANANANGEPIADHCAHAHLGRSRPANRHPGDC